MSWLRDLVEWLLCVLGFEREAPPVPPAPKPDLCSADERRMIDAINRYRLIQRDLPPLQPDPVLMEIARRRAPVFSHYQARHGGWVHDEARALGYVATDNIAQGYETPEAAVGDARSGWGDERPGHTVGHNKQMLGFVKLNGQWVDEHFDLVGAGVSGRNYIAVFGRRV